MKKTRVKMTKPLYLGMSILDISKILIYEYGLIILIQSMETRQNFVIQILIVLVLMLKPKIFLKIFLMMLRDGLIHLIMIKKYLFQQADIKKVPGLFKDELGGKIIKEFVALRAEACSYLYDDGN